MSYYKVHIRNNKGFTLVELMIVVAIISILAAFAIPEFNKYRRRAATADLISLASQIVAYENNFFTLNSSYKPLNIVASSSQQVYGDGIGGQIVIPANTSIITVQTTCTINDLTTGTTISRPGFNATITKTDAPGGNLAVVYDSCRDSRPHPQ